MRKFWVLALIPLLVLGVSAFEQVTDLNGSMVMKNNYTSGHIHATAKINGLGNASAEMNANLTGKVNGTSVGRKGKHKFVILDKAKRVSRMKAICLEELRNLTKLRKMASREYRESIGKELDYLRSKVILAGMDAVIGKGEEFGANVSELEKLRNEFANISAELNISTGKEYRENVKIMIRIAVEFKKKAHEIPELQEHSEEVKEAVENVTKDVRERLREKKEQILENAKNVGLAVFDLHVCLAQQKLDKFKNMGVNVTEAQEILDEIKALRPELENAYESGNRTKVAEIKVEIAKRWGDFHRAFIKANREAVRKQYEQVKNKLEEAIDNLKKKGKDTSELEKKLQEFDERAKNMSEKNIKKFVSDVNNFSKSIVSVEVKG